MPEIKKQQIPVNQEKQEKLTPLFPDVETEAYLLKMDNATLFDRLKDFENDKAYKDESKLNAHTDPLGYWTLGYGYCFDKRIKSKQDIVKKEIEEVFGPGSYDLAIQGKLKVTYA